ncbi:unnamed protein product [Rangifer tarandus platyrhynchus]|uniref:Uncharacterized protein n=1 Tax=Rangifer tarandus platyrhynchus TaxID=3082113 RepID=A0ABN8YSX3_RANTA|nr:unnamed protein product [Rangifer tarandus platyrhynchus]
MQLTDKAGIKVVGALRGRVRGLGPLLPQDPCPSPQAWTSGMGVSGLARLYKAGALGSARLRSSRGSDLEESPFAGPPSGATFRGPTAQYSAIRKRAALPPSFPPSSSMPPAGRAALRGPQAPRHRPGLGDPGAPPLHPSLFAFN